LTVLIKIFLLFAQLSVFSFGGGYAMFPILIREIGKNGLVTMDELTDIIAIAGMSPGAVAVNAAVGVGYRAAGIAGVSRYCYTLHPYSYYRSGFILQNT